MLSRDSSVLELQPHREVRPHVGVGGQSVDWYGEQSAPEDFECDAIAIDDGVEDLELLRAEQPSAFFCRVENRAQVSVHTDRRQAVRELLLNHVLGEELRERAVLCSGLERLEVPAR